MADDLDDLLEEIEQKFIKVNRQLEKESVGESIQQSGSSLGSEMTGVCDDILKDIDRDIEEELVISENSNKHKTSFKKKCFPVYLGGSLTSIGLSNIGCPRSCSNLHCISCDFPVSYFDNFRWESSTNYIFLRTNMPNFEKLKSSLEAASGWRAYACQCSHHSTNQLLDLANLVSYSWICKQH